MSKEDTKMMKATERAMLVSLRISSWSARRYDKRISQEVAENHNASIDAGRYTKALLPADANSYKALQNAAAEARSKHYQQTLAWSDEGWRLLPTANYMTYTETMREAKQKFLRALEVFIAEYPELKETAKVRLNGMYHEEDYPSVEDIRSRYSFALEYSPLPDPQDFRITLADDEMAEIVASTENRVQSALKDAQGDAAKRLYEAVAHICERLSQPDAIFKNSLIDNAREVCDALTRLNLGEDAKLEAFRQRVESLAAIHPDHLRDSARVRAIKAAEASKIADAMRAAFGEAVAS
jgi:hypothetical protein